MAQEDYIKREIDKLGKVLASILAKVLLQKDSNSSDVKEFIQSSFKDDLSLDIDKVQNIPDDNLIAELATKYGHIDNNDLKLFADLLFEYANLSSNYTENKFLLRKSNIIYDYLLKKDVFYFDIPEKKRKTQTLLG